MKNQTLVVSGLIGFDGYREDDLPSASIFGSKQQGSITGCSLRLDDVVAGLELLVPHEEVERNCYFDLLRIVRMAGYG